VEVKFSIALDGAVTRANATGVHPDVASCVANVILGLEFPKPTGGGVEVTYPFVFEPAR